MTTPQPSPQLSPQQTHEEQDGQGKEIELGCFYPAERGQEDVSLTPAPPTRKRPRTTDPGTIHERYNEGRKKAISTLSSEFKEIPAIKDFLTFLCVSCPPGRPSKLDPYFRVVLKRIRVEFESMTPQAQHELAETFVPTVLERWLGEFAGRPITGETESPLKLRLIDLWPSVWEAREKGIKTAREEFDLLRRVVRQAGICSGGLPKKEIIAAARNWIGTRFPTNQPGSAGDDVHELLHWFAMNAIPDYHLLQQSVRDPRSLTNVSAPSWIVSCPVHNCLVVFNQGEQTKDETEWMLSVEAPHQEVVTQPFFAKMLTSGSRVDTSGDSKQCRIRGISPVRSEVLLAKEEWVEECREFIEKVRESRD